jgi:nicotinamidase-related amidase
LRLDPKRCAMIVQDLQNDVIMEGGAFAASGSPAHAKQQNVVENVRRLADAARARGVIVIHVWFIVEPGAPGMTLNAPLFEGVVDNNAMVRGSWGAAPVAGLEPRPGDFVVEKMRMSAWEGTRLGDHPARSGRDVIINTGAWTNMSVEHTGAHRRRQGLLRGAAGGLLLDHERRLAQCGDQLRAAERLGRDQGRRRDRGARLSRVNKAFRQHAAVP